MRDEAVVFTACEPFCKTRAMTLAELLRNDATPLEAITSHLDASSHAERVAATRSLSGKLFPKLYELAAQGPAATPETFVPADVPPMTVVRHFGVNNMPAFRYFEKPMYRDEAGVIAGRNVQTWEKVTGPGYFVVASPSNGELFLDYVSLPQHKPEDWPAIRDNRRGLSKLVFGGLQDVMRTVSRHVTIGKVFRDGKEMSQYFILVREG